VKPFVQCVKTFGSSTKKEDKEEIEDAPDCNDNKAEKIRRETKIK
jgi:hypothetical protein